MRNGQGAAIDTRDDTSKAPAADGRPAEARHVPPPEVPGGEEAGGQTWPKAPAATGGPTWPEARAAQAGDAPPALTEGVPGGSAPPAATRAAGPREPFYLPQADWRWPAAVAGFLAGAAPQALLQLLSELGGGTPSGSVTVTTLSALAVAASALVLYSWQALAAWLFSLRGAGRTLLLWGFRRPTRAFWWVVPLGLVAVYGFGIVHDIVLQPEQQAIVGQFPRSTAGAALFVLVAVVLAPLFEEALFRGFLFRGLANSFGWVWGALISAGVFGIAHLQLDVFLPLAALGFALAWAYRQTGSLWTPITMHAVFNAFAVLAWALTG